MSRIGRNFISGLRLLCAASTMLSIATSHAATVIWTADSKDFASDGATSEAVESLKKSPINRSPVLNEAAREEALLAIVTYQGYKARLTELLSRGTSDLDAKITADIGALTSALMAHDPREIRKLSDDMMGIYNYVAGAHSFLSSVLTPDNPHGVYDGDEILIDMRPEHEQAFLEKYARPEKANQIQADFKVALGKAIDRLQKDQAEARLIIPRLQRLSDAWTERKSALEKAIEDSSTAGKVAGQLWVIIAAFCTFALAIFWVVRKFAEEIQLELVASGQIVQFATVMMILIVVCVLGMSGILQENTLGTLLGGVGGYVLSQGVGRAAARKATNAASKKKGS
jgi:hypothetical protein